MKGTKLDVKMPYATEDGRRRVVDLGAGTNPDPRANETVDYRDVGDHQFDLDDRWDLVTNSVDGLLCNHTFEHVDDPKHFFDEAARVLKPYGWLEITMPLGKNAVADDDHDREWLWTTPAHYCRERRRGWDSETGFLLVDREMDAHLQGFLAPLDPLFQLAVKLSPGEAAYRCSAGELTARYRRVRDED